MARLILIVGGARSGKSRFAQQLAQRLGGDNVLFVATAEAGDAEMEHRIATHRQTRPAAWTTLEATHNIGAALDEFEKGCCRGAKGNYSERHDVALIDCMTLLVSNLLLSSNDHADVDAAKRAVDNELDCLLTCLQKRRGTAILVSGEVGMSLVPDNALARVYRDLLGWANQKIAQSADSTYLMVAGMAIEMKSLATTLERAAAECVSCEHPQAPQ